MAGINDLAIGLLREFGMPTADLSCVERPRGRVDYLASRLLAEGIRQSGRTELMELHSTMRPLIDGQLTKHLRKVKLPGVVPVKEKRK